MPQAEAKRRAVSPPDAAKPVNGAASDSQEDADDNNDEDESDEEELLGLAAQHRERALQTLDARPAGIKPSTQACVALLSCSGVTWLQTRCLAGVRIVWPRCSADVASNLQWCMDAQAAGKAHLANIRGPLLEGSTAPHRNAEHSLNTQSWLLDKD